MRLARASFFAYYLNYMTKGNNMTTYTGSELQSKIGEVLNDVQTLGWVRIKNRSRPNMVLMTQKELDDLLKRQYEKGASECKE